MIITKNTILYSWDNNILGIINNLYVCFEEISIRNIKRLQKTEYHVLKK